jgi:dihydrofolate reductase
MKSRNTVFIARSLDGYIADKNGGLDWLSSVPNPEHLDLGYGKFIKGMDAIVMGRTTFDIVRSFDIEWPYKIPVFVLSNSMKSLPEGFENKAEIVNGLLSEILELIHKKGYTRLYIDGGVTVQNFLKEDLIDELIITTIPILLGGGTPLFGKLPKEMEFEHVESVLHLDALVQDSYRRKREI